MIDDEMRSIRWESSIDHERGIVYVRDDEEPEGIMAFSLETGEWIRTYIVPTGDGPQELSRGIHGLSAASGGRLYVAGALKVIEFGSQGSTSATGPREFTPGTVRYATSPASPRCRPWAASSGEATVVSTRRSGRT